MWKYFLVVVVVVVIVAVAIAPVINIRERANERTRNSFNELDFARRANSFLHLHSVLAVNHFSARVTTGRKSNSINIHFFLFFPTPGPVYIRGADRFTMRSCDRGIDV